MNKEQAIYYLQSSGFSEEQVQTVIDALEMPYQKAFEDIRAEIKRKANSGQWSEATIYGLHKALAIIDKHNPDKAESEDK